MSTELSPTMEKALTWAREAGKLIRHTGGYWRKPGEAHAPNVGDYVGTRTIESLVARGLLVRVSFNHVVLPFTTGPTPNHP